MPSTINAQPGNAIAFTSLIKAGGADANLVLQSSGANAVIINQNQIANFVSTGATTIPRGTTAQRPGSPVNGMIRYNTDLNKLETYINAWIQFP